MLSVVAAFLLLMASARASFDLSLSSSGGGGEPTLDVTVVDSTVAAGGAGTFDVSIFNDSRDSIQLGGFNLDLSVPSESGITLTGVDFPSNYVFAGASLDQDSSLPLATPGLNTTTYGSASDGTDAPLGYVTLNPGDSYNLAQLSFTADSNLADGTIIPITLDTSSYSTSLSAGNGNPISFDGVDGQITVNGQVTAVPEPGSLVLLSQALLAGLAC